MITDRAIIPVDLSDSQSPRSSAMAGILQRLADAMRCDAETPQSVDVLRTLADRKLLRLTDTGASDAVDVMYSASSNACALVALPESPEAWNAKLQERHRKTLAPREGALFVFEREDGGSLEAFITDWSPFPAACALAVFPAHPVADGVGANAFTGRFARHPLTGASIPIWTADWVAPGVGTGVVVVNPAHSAVDLQFARMVGLPIQFSLWPQGLPENEWPVAPVVKTGLAVRSGIADGLPPTEAARAYFDWLAARNLARRYTDVRAPAVKIGELRPNGAGVWQKHDTLLLPDRGDSTAARGDLVVSSWVTSVLSSKPGPAVVCPSLESSDRLLAARLLHQDGLQTPLQPRSIWLVQEPAIMPDLPRDEGLLSMLFEPLTSPPAFRKNTLDQVRAFLKNHTELMALAERIPDHMGAPALDILRAVVSSLLGGQPDQALNHLRGAQKAIKGSANDGARWSLLPSYFAGIGLLTELPVPGWVRVADLVEQL